METNDKVNVIAMARISGSRAGAILWDNMQWQLGAVQAGDWLMKIVFMGIILTIWLNKNLKSTKL